MKNIMLFESYVEEIYEAKAEKGLMHKILKVPVGKKITDVYKDPKELATDLLKGIKSSKIVATKEVRKKATSMLAFAANWGGGPKNDVMDKALKMIKKIEIPGVPLSN
jgi:hypothetical protein